jgi:hypothetical protein
LGGKESFFLGDRNREVSNPISIGKLKWGQFWFGWRYEMASAQEYKVDEKKS